MTEAGPAVTALHPNAPNPFKPTTSITFDLAHDGHVRLQVLDVGGRLVKTLVDEPLSRSFDKTIGWTGLGDDGHRVPSGVYFYHLITADLTATRKMVMLK